MSPLFQSAVSTLQSSCLLVKSTRKALFRLSIFAASRRLMFDSMLCWLNPRFMVEKFVTLFGCPTPWPQRFLNVSSRSICTICPAWRQARPRAQPCSALPKLMTSRAKAAEERQGMRPCFNPPRWPDCTKKNKE